MPVIYIDILFIVNFYMNTAILFCASLLLRKTVLLIRLFLTSGFLSFYAVFMFFPDIGFLYSGICKLCVLFLASEIGFKAKGIFPKFKCFISVLSCYALFAGILYALIFTTDFGTRTGSAISNGEIYFDIKISTLFFSVTPAFICVYILSYIKKTNAITAPQIFKVSVKISGKELLFSAYADTGCMLKDPLSGKPAVIISQNAAKRLLSTEAFRFLTGKTAFLTSNEYIAEYRRIPISTVSGKTDVLQGFVSEWVSINNIIFPETTIVVSNAEYLCKDNNFDMIFNPNMFYEKLTTEYERITDYA